MALLRNLYLASVLLTLPGLAQADTKPAPGTSMNCPMMGEAATTRQDMSAMMTDMSAMMKDTSDPALNVRMQKMHEKMAMMSASMRKMGGGMMEGGMMGRGRVQAKPDGAPAKAPAAPDDHAAHHPK